VDEPAKSAEWSRRDLVHGAAFFALIAGVPLAAVKLSRRLQDDAPTDRQRKLIEAVSQLVIPATDTPGAGDIGVGDFVILALAHGLEGSRLPASSAAAPSPGAYRRPDGSLLHLDWLEDDLDRRARGDFLAVLPAAREAALRALDTEAFADSAAGHPWRTIKALILTGYYTSEIGGSKELNYELVPGRWDPDLPLKQGDRAYSSDWTAVDFG